VTALWEAVELYVGDRKPQRRFTRGEVRAIVKRACEGLADAKADRVKKVLCGSLNHSSIKDRLEYALTQEGVPMTPDELVLLRRLGDERNLAVHGSMAAPTHEEIDRGVAVMSRAIITRWQRPAR
jgi:hypothetical protein